MIRILKNFFLCPSDPRALASVRIAIGIAALVECALIFPYLEPLYGQYGFLQADLIEALTGRAFPGFLAAHGLGNASYLQIVTVLYAVHTLSALTFTLGFRTRTSAILLWLTQTLIMASGYYSSYGVDRYFQNVVFLLAVLPLPRAWSVDSWLAGHRDESRPAWTLTLRLLQIFLLMTYLDAGISKSMGPDWWSGEAIWRVLNQPEFRRFDFLWLASLPWLPKLLGWGTVVVEAGYAFFAFTRLGPLWTFGIVCLHLGIASFMEGLTLFGLTLAALNATLFWGPRLLREGMPVFRGFRWQEIPLRRFLPRAPAFPAPAHTVPRAER